MFIEKFNNILSLISKDKHCYVMGDFNLYLSNTIIMFQQRNLSTAYFHTPLFLSSPIQHAPPHNLQPLLTTYSQTTVYRVCVTVYVFNGIILIDLSKHLSVFAYFNDAILTRKL